MVAEMDKRAGQTSMNGRRRGGGAEKGEFEHSRLGIEEQVMLRLVAVKKNVNQETCKSVDLGANNLVFRFSGLPGYSH